MLKHIVRIKDPGIRILLVTAVWPFVAGEYYVRAWWNRWPTNPGFLWTMYDVACGGF